MQREFCEVVTMSEAQARCPWAAEIAEVEGGFLAFASMDDYTTWAKALTDHCGGVNCCGCEVCTPDTLDADLEALDIATEDKSTIEWLMFQELDLECSDSYAFPECPWDSVMGYTCLAIMRKAKEFVRMLPGLDDHQPIWKAAFDQCEILYRS